LRHTNTASFFGGDILGIKLVCSKCNTEIEVTYLDDIVECPNCGEIVSKENTGAVKW
jgi:DNA-directed RNA polymerase subunit RPC12/RpoP